MQNLSFVYIYVHIYIQLIQCVYIYIVSSIQYVVYSIDYTVKYMQYVYIVCIYTLYCNYSYIILHTNNESTTSAAQQTGAPEPHVIPLPGLCHGPFLGYPMGDIMETPWTVPSPSSVVHSIFSDWQPMFDVGDVTTDCCHLLLSKVYGFVGEKSPRNLEIGKLNCP